MTDEPREDSKKNIKLNESTMLDLVAELARKESVVSKSFVGNIQRSVPTFQATSKDTIQYDDYIPKNTFKKIVANTGRFLNKKSIKQLEHFPPNEIDKDIGESVVPLEDSTDKSIDQKLMESRRKLEEKSRLYEQLQEGLLKDERDNTTGEYHYLVDFDSIAIANAEKKIEQKKILLAKAAELAEAEYFDKMKEKWLKNKAKKKLVEHYQDVIDGELKEHGPAYFSFSTDEKEREAQLDMLNQLRSKTVTEREKSDKKLQIKQNALQRRLTAIRKRRIASKDNVMEHNAQDYKPTTITTLTEPCDQQASDQPLIDNVIDNFLKQQKNQHNNQ